MKDHLKNSAQVSDWSTRHRVPLLRIKWMAEEAQRKGASGEWAIVLWKAKMLLAREDDVTKPSWSDVSGAVDTALGYLCKQVGGRPWQHMDPEDWGMIHIRAIGWWLGGDMFTPTNPKKFVHQFFPDVPDH